MALRVAAKRVYDSPGASDGTRVLVDRLWPRGLRKEKARGRWDAWRKDLAPSAELRRWYGHDPERFAEFARRYRDELRRSGARRTVRDLARGARALTLLTATHDLERSGAAVLAEYLRAARKRTSPAGAASG